MKKSRKDRLKCVVYESTLSTADAVPLPQWGRLRYESSAIPISSERIHACVKKQYPRQSLPRVGKVASKASRIGFWRYERERRRSSQVRRLRKHPSAADAAFLPQWGRQRGGGFAAPKGSQPRLAALGSPFQGKGLAWTHPPSYGRRCPEGAEVGWGKRDEKDRGEIVSSASFARAALSPYRQSEYMHVWKNNTPGKAFPAWGRWRAKRAG